MLSRVSPFRNRWINGYLLLPNAYRSLSRLSSALSAKASTLRSFLLDLLFTTSYSVRKWGLGDFSPTIKRLHSCLQIFVNRLVCYFSDVLIKIFIFLNLSLCMKFSRYKCIRFAEALEVASQLRLTFLSVIRNLSLLNSLITGKTSCIKSALPCWFRLASHDARFIFNLMSA